MARFRDIKTLQKFTSAHASIHNHFNLDHTSIEEPHPKRTAPPLWLSGANWRPKEPLTRTYRKLVRIRLTAPNAGCILRSASSPP